MNYVLCAISILAGVAKTVFANQIAKKSLKGARSLWRFNAVMFFVTFLVFLIPAITSEASSFSLLLGLAFGVVTVVHSVCNLLAFARGPMHVTNLIVMSSLIVPSFWSVMMGEEKFSFLKLPVIAVLFVFIFLAIGKKDDKHAERGWLFYTFVTFFLQALIGIMQKIHQGSEYKGETSAFLAAAFLCSFLFAAVMSLSVKGEKMEKSEKSGAKFLLTVGVIAAVSGVCVYLNNDLNLKLSGIMPGQIFFPLINGGMLFFNTIAAFVLFKEKLSRRQIIGLIGGMITLVILCVIP